MLASIYCLGTPFGQFLASSDGGHRSMPKGIGRMGLSGRPLMPLYNVIWRFGGPERVKIPRAACLISRMWLGTHSFLHRIHFVGLARMIDQEARHYLLCKRS